MTYQELFNALSNFSKEQLSHDVIVFCQDEFYPVDSMKITTNNDDDDANGVLDEGCFYINCKD